MADIGKSGSKALFLATELFLWLYVCDLIVHMFTAHAGYIIYPDRQTAEHRESLDHSDVLEDEDNFIPLALESANAAISFDPKTNAANFLASSRSISPLLPPPKAV